MAKEKLGLRAKLKKRKYRRPNPFLYFIYWFACKFIILRKLKPEFYYEARVADCKGPCFLIWNHLSRIDHAYLTVAAWPKRINIWAAWVEFFRSHLAVVFRLNLILPKKNQLRVEYARNQSFPLDWQLFWETIGGVFRKAENAAKEKKRQN